MAYRALQTIYALGVAEDLSERSALNVLDLREYEEVISLEQDLQMILKSKEDLERCNQMSSNEYELLRKSLFEVEEKYYYFLDSIRLNNLRKVGFTHPQPAKLEEVQTVLPDRAVLLEYVLDKEGAFCFVTTRRNSDLLDLGARDTIFETLGAVQESLQNGISPSAKKLRFLGERLWDPVLAVLSQRPEVRPKTLSFLCTETCAEFRLRFS